MPAPIAQADLPTRDMEVPLRRSTDLVGPVRVAAPAPVSIGPYWIQGVLGEGGMGIVYRAEDRSTGKRVAVKTVRVPHEVDVAGLRREIRALWRLRHPGVVRILGDGLSHGCPWFAMELLEGTTLKRLNSRLWPERPAPGGRLPAAAGGRLREVLMSMQQICRALAYVHRHGIVHRDLKPTNIFLRPDGHPVLVDFGLVCRFPGGRTRESLEVGGLRVGTVHYMAPEQIRADLVDARADLYSLGCMMFESITGRRPFEASNTEDVAEQQLTLEPPRPSALVSELPPGLEDLILQLLVKDPRERVGYAEDVAASLARFTEMDEVAEARERYFFRPAAAGRKRVLGDLGEALAGAARGRGRMVFLGGPRGIGKTFILGHVTRKASALRFNVITGPCVPGAVPDANLRDGADASEYECAPLQPFRNLLRFVADRCRKNGPSMTARLLGGRGELLAPFEPSLWAICGARDASVSPALEASRDPRGPVLGALVDALAACARAEPMLLVLDDLQWADSLTLALLAHLADGSLDGLPLLVVGAYRSDVPRADLRELVESQGSRSIELKSLDRDAVSTMVSDLLAVPAPADELISLVAQQANGNPGRVVECLRAAVADGRVERREGRWVIPRPLVVAQEPPPAAWM